MGWTRPAIAMKLKRRSMARPEWLQVGTVLKTTLGGFIYTVMSFESVKHETFVSLFFSSPTHGELMIDRWEERTLIEAVEEKNQFEIVSWPGMVPPPPPLTLWDRILR